MSYPQSSTIAFMLELFKYLKDIMEVAAPMLHPYKDIIASLNLSFKKLTHLAKS